jgi:hypothetical protein
MKCQRCGKDVDPVYPHTCTPLALKLANQLELRHIGWEDDAAAELRRLYEENVRLTAPQPQPRPVSPELELEINQALGLPWSEVACPHCNGSGLAEDAPQPQPKQEPFGYFKAEPFGWTDCAETDDGAIALYDKPQGG